MKRLFLLLFILAAQTAYPQWEKTSWKNEPTIEDFWVQDSIIVLYTNNALKISTDYGKTFPIVSKLPIKSEFYNLFIQGDSLLYTVDNRLISSTDLGRTWICSPPYKPALPLQNYYAERDNYIYDIWLNKGKIYATTRLGLLVTSDFGYNWKILSSDSNSNFYGGNFYSFNHKGYLLKHPTGTENTLYLYEYNEKEECWVKREDFRLRLAQGRSYDNFYLNEETITVAVDTTIINFDLYDPPKILYISKDGGKHWDSVVANMDEGRPVTATILGDCILLEFRKFRHASYKESNYCYTTNLGKDWVKVKKNDWPVALNTDGYDFLSANGNFYASSTNELWVSEDTLKSWRPLLNSKIFPSIGNMVSYKKDLFVLAESSKENVDYSGYIYISSDQGNTWKCAGLDFEGEGACYPRLSVGNKKIQVDNCDQFLTSTDEGVSWIAEKSPDPDYNRILIGDYEVYGGLPGDPKLIRRDKKGNRLPLSLKTKDELDYRFVRATDGKLFLPSENGFYVSFNNGINWKRYPINIPGGFSIDGFSITNKTIFCIGEEPNLIYVSTDNGLHWEERNEGIEFFDQTRIGPITTQGDYVFCVVSDAEDPYKTCIYRAKISDFLKKPKMIKLLGNEKKSSD